MNPFEKLMTDIFNNEDFLEPVAIDGINYSCIVSTLSDGFAFTEAGREAEETFSIDLKLPIKNMPQINSKVIFRGGNYKVSSIETDSANTSIKLVIIGTSKGIE
jgi:hypothetical protein